MIVIVTLLTSCATLGTRTYFPPRHLHWRSQPCDKALTKWAYQQLLEGKGSAELSLYYFRCREYPQYLKDLKNIKRRWQ